MSTILAEHIPLSIRMKLLQDDVPSSSKAVRKMTHQPRNPSKLSVKEQSHKVKSNNEFKKVTKLSQDRLKAYGLDPKRYLKKLKYGSGKNSSS